MDNPISPTSTKPFHPSSSSSSSTTSLSSFSSLSTDVHIGSALIIGGCGFLGHHIVSQLLQEPTCTSISVMSRSPFKNRFAGVTYHIGDITKREHVDHVLSQVRPNVVINTASPHAYVDHEHAHEYFTVNVEGNENLIDAMRDEGTVRAYVYTSSGPIISSPGAGYVNATEDHPTLAWPIRRKGDPYHLAKAIGDSMVLEANRKFGFRTACIRPTALYGEGDFQMVEPVIRVLDEQQTNIWLGYNDIDMDVVYVGHVAEAEILAVKGLLRGINDPKAPKVDGEAFNITDDAPCRPWTFFRKYWVFAGDKTPLSAIWYIHPTVVMFFSHFAEWWAWTFSLGKKRPQRLKVERMEFAIYTRTYSIQKIRDRLGFEPWANQRYSNQDAAVKGALDWWLLPENHGPIKLRGLSSWPETPFRLISSTGAKSNPSIPTSHYCVRNAQIMAMTHNTFFRALNSIYHHAPLIQPGTQEAADFMSYCLVAFEFIHHHQIAEEKLYFPAIEKVTCIPGLMESNVSEHRNMDEGLDLFRRYVESTPKELYDGETLCAIIDNFSTAFEAHNHAEIETILSLHDKISSADLKCIDETMRADAEKNSDIFKVAPFVLGNQDRKFILDDEICRFPLQPEPILIFVRIVLAARHAELWRFNPSDLHGRSREQPKDSVSISSLKMHWSWLRDGLPVLMFLYFVFWLRNTLVCWKRSLE